MNRKETTKFLSALLEQTRLSGNAKYWAKEVSLDYGSVDVRRIDYLQFEPPNQCSVSAIEKGIFIVYEVKSCKADFNSGFGTNFIGEKNYFVMTMETYKQVMNDIPHKVGVLVPIPEYAEMTDEFFKPTPIDGNISGWKFATILPAYPQGRKRSMTELLFCMLRSGKKWSAI